nr:MAG TPA: Head Tail Connector Protein [Caudoviricetes sp.]
MIETEKAVSAVTLEEAKAHLRVDHDTDDELIKALCLSCTQMAEHILQRALITRDGVQGYGTSPNDVPKAIKQWILLHVGFFYENRQAASSGVSTPIPRLDALLDPFRTWQ